MKALKRIPYWYLIVIPVLLIVLGAASNQLVLIANGGRFPVLLNAAQIGFFMQDSGKVVDGISYLDEVHTVMRPEDHLRVLADIINLGRAGVMSIGDLFIELGQFFWNFTPFMWLALAVRKLSIA